MNKLLPLLAWVVALAMLAGAAQELRRQRDSTDASAALAAVPQFKLKSNPLGLKDYQAIQKKVAVFGTVELVAAPAALSIKAATLSDYAAWRLTIDQVLLDSPGISWRIDSLCSGTCASGEAHKAVLVGNRLQALVQESAEAPASPASRP
jgi:hypothetical protein